MTRIYLLVAQGSHVLVWAWASFFPFLTNDPRWLAAVIAGNVLALLSWVLFEGRCILSDLEHYLGARDEYYSNGVRMSVIATLLTRLTGERDWTYHTVMLLPLVSCGVALYKLTKLALAGQRPLRRRVRKAKASNVLKQRPGV